MEFTYKLYRGPTERDEWLHWIKQIEKEATAATINRTPPIIRWEIHMTKEDMNMMLGALNPNDIPYNWKIVTSGKAYKYESRCYMAGYEE